MVFSRAGVPGLCMVAFIAACGPGKAGDDDSTGMASEGPSGGGEATDATGAGGDSDHGDCADYLACVGAVLPGMLAVTEMSFGAGAACWLSTPEVVQACLDACTQGLAGLAVAFPDVPACGGMGSTTGPEPTTGGPEPTTGGPEPTTGGPVGGGLSGDFLLAVSTTVDRSKPFQFVASNVVSEVDGQVVLSTCLQPLSLAQGKVTTPREPVGAPLCFAGVPLVGGAFTLDLGIVMIAGAANPITGADIVVSMVMDGMITGDDSYCGTVSGNVMQPPIGQIDGSTFAAVRLTQPGVLPDPVVIDCMGTSVSDP